jgi:hypothetical protein
MPDHLLLRLKAFFLVSCGLGIAAVSGWAGFAYKIAAEHRLSDQLAEAVAERNAITAQRDAAIHEVEKLRLSQLEASKFSAGGASEYHPGLELNQASSEALPAKDEMAHLVKRIQQRKDIDFSQTGSIRKTNPPRRQAH